MWNPCTKLIGGERGGSKNRISGNYRWFCTKLIEGGKGGVKKSYIRKLPLVMYKIDRTGGWVQKLFTLTDPPKALSLLLKLLQFFVSVISNLYITSGNFLIYDFLTPPLPPPINFVHGLHMQHSPGPNIMPGLDLTLHLSALIPSYMVS